MLYMYVKALHVIVLTELNPVCIARLTACLCSNTFVVCVSLYSFPDVFKLWVNPILRCCFFVFCLFACHKLSRLP